MIQYLEIGIWQVAILIFIVLIPYLGYRAIISVIREIKKK